MRELRLKIYGMHNAGGSWSSRTLRDLLFEIPMLRKFIPPFQVLNDLLRHGVPHQGLPDGLLPDGKVQYDAGMSGGCAWKPFEMTREEYEALVLDLLTDPELQLEVLESPPEVQTYGEWLNWIVKLKYPQIDISLLQP
jgi:hypothetical protein